MSNGMMAYGRASCFAGVRYTRRPSFSAWAAASLEPASPAWMSYVGGDLSPHIVKAQKMSSEASSVTLIMNTNGECDSHWQEYYSGICTPHFNGNHSMSSRTFFWGRKMVPPFPKFWSPGGGFLSATITVHQSASDAIWRVATLGAKMVVNTAHFVHIFCPATTECLLARRRPGAGESNSRFPVYLRVRTAEKLRHARAVCQLHCQRDGHKAWPLVVKATRTHLCKGAPCHGPLPFPPVGDVDHASTVCPGCSG